MDAVGFTQDLVAFDSPSRQSNSAVTDYIQQQLNLIGAVTERIDYQDEFDVAKSCVVGKLGNGEAGFAYFAHSDVVPADNWEFPHCGPFEPTIRDGRLYGRGSCDMKGSLACMLAALQVVDAKELRHPVYVTVTADEEIGYGGAREVARTSRLYAEMRTAEVHAVIGEPTGLDIVYAHKGVCGFIATSHGRAAHSSTRAGVNANLAMIPFLVEMKAIHDETEQDSAWHNTEFDPPVVSWNIGVNDHNPAINITAPKSVCTVYFRPMPGTDSKALIDRARAAAERHGLEFQVKAQGAPVYSPPNSEYVQEMVELADHGPARTVAYGTDGAVLEGLSNLVVCGPGDIAQAHTSDEWISLEQLEAGTKLYQKMIRRWCC